jgi:RecA-family ATPase
LREHTYVHRFRDIFGQMGLSGSSVKDLADLKAQPGSTQEVQ